MRMRANDMYFYLPPAIFQFMFVSRLLFEFLCRLIKTLQSQTNEICFLAFGMFTIFLRKTQSARGRISCPLKYCLFPIILHLEVCGNVNVSCENMFL